MANLKIARGYEEDFDPDVYLNSVFQGVGEEGDGMGFLVGSLHEIFASGTIRGEKLLDIGTGPGVHSVISASRHVTEIHLSDLVDRNRTILQQWLDGTPNVMSVFEYVLARENDGTTLELRVNEVRKKVKKIYPLDLRLAEPIKHLDCKYDVITTCLCLEAAAKTNAELAVMVNKVAEMLNLGGYLVWAGVTGQSFYTVGDFRFDCLKINGEEVRSMITNAGFEIKTWLDNYIQQDQRYDSDFTGLFVMSALKTGPRSSSLATDGFCNR